MLDISINHAHLFFHFFKATSYMVACMLIFLFSDYVSTHFTDTFITKINCLCNCKCNYMYICKIFQYIM